MPATTPPRRRSFAGLLLSAALAPLGWIGCGDRRRRVARVRMSCEATNRPRGEGGNAAIRVDRSAPLGKREHRRRIRNGSIALLLSVLMIVGPEQVYALNNDAAAVHAIVTAAIGSVPPSSVAYTYDDNGNMITKAVDGGTPTNYAYDAENRLVSIDPQTVAADIVTYAYDDDGIRKSKSVGDSTVYFLTDKNRPYAQVLEERDETGALLVRYTYGHDLISQTRPGTPDITRYYHYDGQMSTRMLSDENATPTVTDNYNYDAFGEQLNANAGSTSNNYLYTGEQFDTDADFYYLRARYYDQQAGRFSSRDSFDGRSTQPATHNRYTYAGSNPIDRIDPSGHEFSTVGLAFAIAGIGALAAIVFNGIANVALGNRVFAGAFGAGIFGALLAPLAVALPALGLLLAAAGFLHSLLVSYEIFSNPRSSLTQQGAAVLLVALSALGGAMAARHFASRGWLNLRLNVGKLSRANPKKPLSSEPILAELLDGLPDDAFIHLTDLDPSVTAILKGNYWVRYGDVKHMTLKQYKVSVVGPMARASSPNAKTFAIRVIADAAKTFEEKAPNNFARVMEFLNTTDVAPDAIAVVKTGGG